MPCSVSWHLPFLLFTFIPIARADWNFDPPAANNIPSPQVSVLATNNELPENPILDPTLTGVKGVEDISVTASDQSQGNTLSNGFELASDQTDAMIPEGPLMAEGESCLPNNGRSSRKMRVRRDQGICELNPPKQFREDGSQPPNTEQQNKPQGQVTGSKKPPGGGKKRRKSVTVIRVTAEDQPAAEQWFPKEDRPKSDKSRCKSPGYEIPVCAEFVDSIEMFPAVTGIGPICILVPATALPCVDREVEWCCQLVDVAFTGTRVTFQAPNPFMLWGANCIRNDGKTPLVIEMPEDPLTPPENGPGPF